MPATTVSGSVAVILDANILRSTFCRTRLRPGPCMGGPEGLVGADGLEPPTSYSQSTRATYCATPRLGMFGIHFGPGSTMLPSPRVSALGADAQPIFSF